MKLADSVDSADCLTALANPLLNKAGTSARQESSNRSRDAEVLKARFQAAVALHHFQTAWDAALLLKSPQLWQALGEAYLHDLDAEPAMR